MGTLASKPNTAKECETGRILGLPYAAAGMQGWRRGMEDAHVVEPGVIDGRSCALCAVFDGHGGKGVAKYVARSLGDVFSTSLAEAATAGDTGEARVQKALGLTFEALDERMRTEEARAEITQLECGKTAVKDTLKQKTANGPTSRAFGRKGSTLGGAALSADADIADAADKAVEGDAASVERLEELVEEATGSAPGPQLLSNLLTSHATPESMGATAVVCALMQPEESASTTLEGWTLVCANAGDSRAVLCRGGEAIALSEDHKPDDDIERNRIYAAGGHVRNGRVCDNLNLSRALGDFTYKDFSVPAASRVITCVPDFKTVKLRRDDEFLLIGCDGIFEKSSRQELVDFVRSRLAEPKPEEMEDLQRVMCEYLDHSICTDLSHPDFDGSGCDNMTLIVVRLNPPDRGSF